MRRRFTAMVSLLCTATLLSACAGKPEKSIDETAEYLNGTAETQTVEACSDTEDCNYSSETYSEYSSESGCGQYSSESSDSADYNTVSDPTARPQGSVNTVEGKTVFVTLFVNDSGNVLGNDGRWNAQQSGLAAAKYIEGLAQSCGKGSDVEVWSETNSDLSFIVEMNGAISDADIYGSGLETYRQNAQSVMATIPVADIEQKYGTDSIGFILVMPEQGRGFAYSYNESYGDMTYEFVTVYANDNAAVWAHEMLHTFGAMDLYAVDDIEGYSNSYADIYNYIASNYVNPPEIMNNTDVITGEYTIDQVASDITLAMLGLIDTQSVLAQFPELYFPDEPGVAVA